MRSWRHTTVIFLLGSAIAATAAAWNADPAPAASAAPAVSWTVTTGDQSQLATAQHTVTFGPLQPTDYAWSAISVDDARRFQKVQGTGAALTESSAVLIDRLRPPTGPGCSSSCSTRSPEPASASCGCRSEPATSRCPDYTFDDMPWGADRPDPGPVSASTGTGR